MTASLLGYLIEASVCLALFYAIYRFGLRNETFHGLNRAYLVVTVLLSLVIPVVEVPVSGGAATLSPLEPVGRLPHRVSRYLAAPALCEASAEIPQAAAVVSGSAANAGRPPAVRIRVADVVLAVYVGGFVLLGVRLLVGLAQAVHLVRGGRVRLVGDVPVVESPRAISPCCFLNRVVIHRGALTEGELETIIRHEQVHIRQRHAFDGALAQGLVVLLWFNPIAWLYRAALRQTHEYLADAGACGVSGADRSYLTLMLRQMVHPVGSALAHCFGLGSIERRVHMLGRAPSAGRARLKLLWVLPVAAVLLAAFVVRFERVQATEISLNTMGGERAMTTRTDPYAAVVLEDMEAIFGDILEEMREKDYVERSYIYTRLACMRAAGWEDVDYETLMPVSGYGLTFAYEAKAQSGAHFHRPAGTDERIARATGFGWEQLRVDDIEQYWEVLKETIDSGRPVHAPHMEEVLFVGYQEAEKKKDRKVRPLAIPVFVKPGRWWSWRQFEKWFAEFGGHLGRFAGREEAIGSRDVAVDVMTALVTLAYDDPRSQDGDFDRVRWGLAGIEAFAADMADMSKKERHFCSGWFGCHDSNPQTTARQLTGRYLREAAGLFDDSVAAQMREAAREYQLAHHAWLTWDRHLGRFGPHDGWRSRKHRLAGAEAAREALAHERRAVETIREALSHLSS